MSAISLAKNERSIASSHCVSDQDVLQKPFRVRNYLCRGQSTGGIRQCESRRSSLVKLQLRRTIRSFSFMIKITTRAGKHCCSPHLLKPRYPNLKCKIILRHAEGAAKPEFGPRRSPKRAQTGQNDGFAPSTLLRLPGFHAPGRANYATVGISGVRRMSPTVSTRSVRPRAIAGVRSRYLLFKPGIDSHNDPCGRAKQSRRTAVRPDGTSQLFGWSVQPPPT
jgi:hypothetical protein